MGFGDPVLEGMPGDRRGIEIASVFRGALADVDTVRRLPPLPETADELRAIARALNAGDGAVFLGRQATERTVRNTKLSDSRVLTFATHGLLAGQITGAAEPALVLTPPAVASAEDDGLLTASEIARFLKLDADWVILSACNTAAGDKPGAEGLSGLAKAFFYAGARALLVSHWSVPSDSTVKLTTAMLAEAAENPGIARAEALKRSMLALMNDPDNPHFAHPMFWAPFVVVGEGGVPMRTAAGTASLPKPKIQSRRQPAIYVTVKNANVRAGPSTGAARIATLPKGTSVTVLGKAEGGDWFRIARGGKALGYVYGPLIRPQ